MLLQHLCDEPPDFVRSLAAASMRAGGVQEGAALEMLHKVNTERCKPPLPSEEVEMVQNRRNWSLLLQKRKTDGSASATDGELFLLWRLGSGLARR